MKLKGKVHKYGANVDTDVIIPARYLSLSQAEDLAKQVRDQSIEMLRRAVEGSDLKVHQELVPHLPRVLWLYLMGIIFFWIQTNLSSTFALAAARLVLGN